MAKLEDLPLSPEKIQGIMANRELGALGEYKTRGQSTYRPSGGGGAGEDQPRAQMSDPLAQIAQLLGEREARANSARANGGYTPGYIQSQYDANKYLRELWDKLMGKDSSSSSQPSRSQAQPAMAAPSSSSGLQSYAGSQPSEDNKKPNTLYTEKNSEQFKADLDGELVRGAKEKAIKAALEMLGKSMGALKRGGFYNGR